MSVIKTLNTRNTQSGILSNIGTHLRVPHNTFNATAIEVLFKMEWPLEKALIISFSLCSGRLRKLSFLRHKT